MSALDTAVETTPAGFAAASRSDGRFRGNPAVFWSLLICGAVLLMLTHLHDHRGEDMDTDANLWDAIGRLLTRFRDPALA